MNDRRLSLYVKIRHVFFFWHQFKVFWTSSSAKHFLDDADTEIPTQPIQTYTWLYPVLDGWTYETETVGTVEGRGYPYMGPVVQSIVSFMSSWRGQLFKFLWLYNQYTDIFVDKMREAFALH